MVNSIADSLASSIKIADFIQDPSFLKKLKKWIGMSSDDEWDKDLYSYLDSYNISSEEDRLDFLKKLLKALEKEYESLLSEKVSQDVTIGGMHEKIVPHKQDFIKVDASPLESNESMLQISDFHEDIVVPKAVEGFSTESSYL